MNLGQLFNPASVAVVGASLEEGTVGNVISRNILELGYQGNVYLVNPKYDEMFGRKCHKKLSDISEPVDLAVVAIPARFVVDEIKANADKIKNFIVISAGFSETGEEGALREKELRNLATEKDLNVLGPNCLGFIASGISLNATFAGGMPEKGNIGLISQSGALAVGMLDIAEKEKYGFSYVISVGNKMDIDECELLDFLSEDKETRVVGMYLEGIKNGPRFIETATRVSKIKPIVLIKAGKTEKSQKAISSHTGALAGSDEIISAVCQKTGIMRAENLEEFFNLLNLISLTDAPKNELAAVITNAGGPGVLATDSFKGKELKIADLEKKVKDKLEKFLPAEASVENPIDLLGDAHEDRYKKTLTVLGKEDFGSLIAILTPQQQTPVNKIATKIIQFKKKTGRNIVASFIGGKRVEKAIKNMKSSGIPNFNFPHLAIEALDVYFQWSARKGRSSSNEKMAKDESRAAKVSEIIEKARAEGRKALFFSEAKKVMAFYAIKTPGCFDILPGDDSFLTAWKAEFGYPVVLKVDSDKVLHKTDKEGLILDLKNDEELAASVKKMRENFPGERLIVQPMLPRKTELILGIKNDPIFGPVVVYGLGGIYTEVFKMVDFLIPPLTVGEIEESIMKSRIQFLFRETRGQSPHNATELAQILLGLSQFSLEAGQIAEFDINPLLVYNNKNEALAIDVKIII